MRGFYPIQETLPTGWHAHGGCCPSSTACHNSCRTALTLTEMKNTIDREVFALKIIRVLNFRIQSILSLNSSAM